MRKHELITGPSGSGKSHTARQRIEDDNARPFTQTWVIDGAGADLLPVADHVTRYASMHGDSANRMLYELLGHAYVRAERLAGLDLFNDFQPGDRRHGLDLISLTIDNVQGALSRENTRALVRILQMARKVGIKVRLTAPDFISLADPMIRHTMNAADRIECDRREAVSA